MEKIPRRNIWVLAGVASVLLFVLIGGYVDSGVFSALITPIVGVITGFF